MKEIIHPLLKNQWELIEVLKEWPIPFKVEWLVVDRWIKVKNKHTNSEFTCLVPREWLG